MSLEPRGSSSPGGPLLEKEKEKKMKTFPASLSMPLKPRCEAGGNAPPPRVWFRSAWPRALTLRPERPRRIQRNSAGPRRLLPHNPRVGLSSVPGGRCVATSGFGDPPPNSVVVALARGLYFIQTSSSATLKSPFRARLASCARGTSAWRHADQLPTPSRTASGRSASDHSTLDGPLSAAFGEVRAEP
jgi:hypothetical protein